ncbi:phosphatidate cytidylyltransferase [Acutalibacter sp. 1XD8-33]|uniref:phosphatidate cytidylyltransferase n=1 Tax=Acutalibacter sp. 1XD8-33 TaxID=2320081 RepID=UPI001FA960B8|nr:phosphatidate cytidylyltransferase [Acutalibacter sp. 1XD8-33]
MKNQSLLQRVLSGIVLGLFAVAVIVFDRIFPLALNIAVALISLAAVEELARALGLQRKWFLYLPSLAASAVVPFCSDEIQFLVYAIYTLILFSAMIVYHSETSFKEVAVLYSMAVMIPCALNTLVALRELNRAHGMFYVLIAVLAAWVADMGAFFAGSLFGKHKLCPEISPKKTVEGAVGGMAADVAVMLLCGVWFSMVFYQGQVGVNYLALFIIGFFGSVISILGDLSFSLIKRSCHIKDFGQVIPGHGGILDRFDSVIFTAPFVYLLVSFLPLAGA